jgi:hypothetical protein
VAGRFGVRFDVSTTVNVEPVSATTVCGPVLSAATSTGGLGSGFLEVSEELLVASLDERRGAVL